MSKEQFRKLDFEVMRHVFDSQNALGRLCDELIYQNDVLARLTAGGFAAVRTEVPLLVMHADFKKRYSIDLMVGDSAIYELKTARQLIGEHEAQVLNYLYIFNSPHGKLVNLRVAPIESRFVNNPLTIGDRYRIDLDFCRWNEFSRSSAHLREIMVELLRDWGGFLALSLYTEALAHFLGGEDKVVSHVPLSRGALQLGTQRVHLLSPDVAFRLTAIPNQSRAFERHLVSLLRHSPLRAIQWINFAHNRVKFLTIT